MSTDSSWFTWALLSALFAALTTVFAKVGVADVDADLATFIRTLVIVVLLGVLVVAAGKWTSPLALPARTLWFLVLSALATGASWVCYFRALKAGDASLVASVDKSSLLLVALFAVAFLGERPAPRQWMGFGLIAAGLLTLGWRR
jgi:transporter family protein